MSQYLTQFSITQIYAIVLPIVGEDAVLEGDELVARNPRRIDHNLGSFRLNTKTGVWADSNSHFGDRPLK